MFNQCLEFIKMVEGCQTPSQLTAASWAARKHTQKMQDIANGLDSKWVKSKTDKEYIRQLEDFIDSVEMSIVKQHKKILGDEEII